MTGTPFVITVHEYGAMVRCTCLKLLSIESSLRSLPMVRLLTQAGLAPHRLRRNATTYCTSFMVALNTHFYKTSLESYLCTTLSLRICAPRGSETSNIPAFTMHGGRSAYA